MVLQRAAIEIAPATWGFQSIRSRPLATAMGYFSHTMIKIGRLKHRVILQRPETAQDGLGQPVLGWVDVVPMWADIVHLSGIESIKSGAVHAAVKASVRMHYRDDVTVAMRLLHIRNLAGGGTATDVYNIKAVLPDREGRQHLDLVCEVCQ